MGHHRLRTGFKAGLCGQVLRRIGLGATGLVLIAQPGRLEHHQVGRFQCHPVLRQRVLNALVLSDGSIKDDALLGVIRCAIQRALPQAHRLSRNENALGVHAVQDVLEALAFFSNAVCSRHRHAIEEHLVRVDRLAAHLLDLSHLDPTAIEVGVKE